MGLGFFLDVIIFHCSLFRREANASSVLNEIIMGMAI